MSEALSGLLRGMCRALREDVLPEVTSAHARGQMAGVIDILEKLQRLVAWSPDVLREELSIINKGIIDVADAIRRAGHEPPVLASPSEAAPTTQSELEARVAAARKDLREMTDWLFDPLNPLPRPERGSVDAVLRAVLRDAMMPERRLVSRADFSGMAGTK